MKQKSTKIYSSSSGGELRARFTVISETTIEIDVQNEQFNNAKLSHSRWIVFLLVAYLAYILLAKQFIILNFAFLVGLAIMVYSLSSLVQSEKVTLVRDFGLHTSTKYTFGKSTNLLIPFNCIHDILINEVIYNLKVIYVLDVLTKGEIYKERPIITLFNNLLPNLECLETCYKLLQTVMQQ